MSPKALLAAAIVAAFSAAPAHAGDEAADRFIQRLANTAQPAVLPSTVKLGGDPEHDFLTALAGRSDPVRQPTGYAIAYDPAQAFLARLSTTKTRQPAVTVIVQQAALPR